MPSLLLWWISQAKENLPKNTSKGRSIIPSESWTHTQQCHSTNSSKLCIYLINLRILAVTQWIFFFFFFFRLIHFEHINARDFIHRLGLTSFCCFCCCIKNRKCKQQQQQRGYFLCSSLLHWKATMIFLLSIFIFHPFVRLLWSLSLDWRKSLSSKGMNDKNWRVNYVLNYQTRDHFNVCHHVIIDSWVFPFTLRMMTLYAVHQR